MAETGQLEEALVLALRLSPGDRLRLVEHVVASVEREITAPPASQEAAEHWGKSLNAFLDTLDLSDWEKLDIDDPVEWVESIRKEDESRLSPFWDGSE